MPDTSAGATQKTHAGGDHDGTGPGTAGHGRRRFTRALLAAAVLAVSGLGVGLGLRAGDGAPATRLGQQAPVTSAVVASTTATSLGGATGRDGPPDSFVASDGKRIVVVSTATGAPQRVLTDEPAPGQNPPRALALSADRAWVYFTRDVGPAHGVYRLPLTGGQPVKIGEEPGIRLAVSADGSRLVNEFQIASPTIVVHDLVGSGGTRAWSVPERTSVSQFAWHPDGRHLGVLLAPWQGASRFVLLDTNYGTPVGPTGPAAPRISGLGGARLVRASSRGCRLVFAQYLARRLAVLERCKASLAASLRLVYLDVTTGAVRGRPFVLDARTFARLGHIDFDASGRHLLLFVSGEQIESSTIWRWSGTGKPVRIATGYHQPAW